MHVEFIDWYKTAVLDPKAETLEARWKVVDKFAAKADGGELLALVRLFLGLPIANKAPIDKFTDALRKADPTLPSGGIDVELRVLAGAVCAAGFDSNEQDWGKSELTALAVTAGGYRRRRKNLILPRIFELCEETLKKRSANRFDDANDDGDLAAAADELRKVCAGANTGQHFEKPMSSFLERLTGRLKSAHDRQRLLQEETNVLWWLFGAHSDDLNVAFSEVDPIGLPLVAGKELAALVEVRPGPIAFPGLLSRVLNGAKRSKSCIADAVNATPKEWRKALKETTPDAMLDLCPIRLAMVRSLEVNDAKSWIKPTEGASGIPLTGKIEPLELAIQSFHEALLLEYAGMKTNA